MKKLMLIVALFCTWNAVQAQDSKTSDQEGAKALPTLNIADYYHINDLSYRRSMQYNDYATAKSALMKMITIDNQNDSLLVNLANIYFEQREWISAVMAAKDAKAINSNNVAAHQIEAYGLQYLGAKQKAAEAFESYYLVSNEKEALYQLSLLQLELKKYKECDTNVNILLQDETYLANKVTVEGTDGKQVQIPMKAVIYNLKGVMESIQGNTAEAKKDINKALEIAPNFKIAQDRLKTLK